MNRLTGERGIDGYKVRFPQKVIQAAVLNSECSLSCLVQSVAFRVENAHAEASSTAGHSFSDRTEPDDTQSFSVDFASDKMVGLAARKAAGSERAVALHDSARHRQEKCPVKVRGCLCDDRRACSHRYAPCSRSRHINSGRRDRHRGNYLEIWVRINYFRVHTIVEQTEKVVVSFERS